MTLKQLVEELWPLHRTLVSDGTDRALEIVGRSFPGDSYTVETFPPGTPAWTWRVPERYVVHQAFLETEDGTRICDFAENPLHLVSYSLPVDTWLTWEELAPRLHSTPQRPAAIPWEFKFYSRDWGFCVSHDVLESLPRAGRYHAVIDSEFIDAPAEGLRVGVGLVHPVGGQVPEAGELIVCAHICHPRQANDDAAGVASAIGAAQALASNPLPPGSMSVRFLFCPETIGSLAYLSNHEELIPVLRGGIYSEMTGNRNMLALQRTRQDDHVLDRIARYVLLRRGAEFREGPFRSIISNDEIVFNGPGVNVPCLSLSRWPYPEYHTSDDNPDIIDEDMLVDAAQAIEEIARIFASDYVVSADFRGPVFLSGYDLWVDWREDYELNIAIEQLMLLLDTNRTVFEIAETLGLEFNIVRDYVERFRAAGLARATPIPTQLRVNQPGASALA